MIQKQTGRFHALPVDLLTLTLPFTNAITAYNLGIGGDSAVLVAIATKYATNIAVHFGVDYLSHRPR